MEATNQNDSAYLSHATQLPRRERFRSSCHLRKLVIINRLPPPRVKRLVGKMNITSFESQRYILLCAWARVRAMFLSWEQARTERAVEEARFGLVKWLMYGLVGGGASGYCTEWRLAHYYSTITVLVSLKTATPATSLLLSCASFPLHLALCRFLALC